MKTADSVSVKEEKQNGVGRSFVSNLSANQTKDDTSYEEIFLMAAHRRKYIAKSTLIYEGDPCISVFYIIKGSVTVWVEDDSGREIIVSYLNAGDFIGELSLFTDDDECKRSAWIKARTDCEVAELSHAQCKELADKHPCLLYAIGRQMSRRLQRTTRKVSDIAFVDVAGRVQRTLQYLSKLPDAMTHPDGMQIKITRQEIGRIVGCSREMVGRVLKELVAEGVVSVKGKTMVVYGSRDSAGNFSVNE